MKMSQLANKSTLLHKLPLDHLLLLGKVQLCY
jgi:hypothetical protein